MSPVLLRRQDDVFVDGGDEWWFSDTGYIVRWAIIGGIVVFFLAWFVGGHYHAKRRLQQGKQPMLYHRFLVPQERRLPRRNAPHPDFALNQVEGGYNINQPPPPTYDPNAPLPPSYQGDRKLERTPSYDVPPPGPPPGHEQELPPRQEPKKTGWVQKITAFRK